jgi:hypothetical protein
MSIFPSGIASIFLWLVLMGLALWAFRSLKGRRGSAGYPIPIPENVTITQKSMLTVAEAKFFRSLEQAVGGQYLVCPQVPLWTFIDIRSNHAGAAAAFTNRINLKRVDFILVDRRTLTVRMAIELDDRSHQRSDRQRRDAFVETVLKQAGVPLIRIPAARAYESQAIRMHLGIDETDVNGRNLAEAL